MDRIYGQTGNDFEKMIGRTMANTNGKNMPIAIPNRWSSFFGGLIFNIILILQGTN